MPCKTCDMLHKQSNYRRNLMKKGIDGAELKELCRAYYLELKAETKSIPKQKALKKLLANEQLARIVKANDEDCASIVIHCAELIQTLPIEKQLAIKSMLELY